MKTLTEQNEKLEKERTDMVIQGMRTILGGLIFILACLFLAIVIGYYLNTSELLN